MRPPRRTLWRLRGGSTATLSPDVEEGAEVEEDDARRETASKTTAAAEKEWCLRQLQLRQQRLGLLATALSEAGFETPTIAAKAKTGPVRKGWDCLIAGEEPPLPCQIMGEVAPGSKCVAPEGSEKV